MDHLLPPTPPHDPYAEQATLGACLLDSHIVERVRAEVSPDDFHTDRHRHIYQAVLAVSASGQAVDLFTVQDALKAAGRYEDSGGVPYLASVVNACVAPMQGPDYARVVADLARRRRWIYGLMDVLQRSYQRHEDLGDLAQQVQAHTSALLARGGTDGTLLGYAAVEAVEDFRRLAQDGKPLPTWGFDALDSAIGGIPNRYLIVAARPGMGKTTFTLHVAYLNARKTGRWWVYVSQETSTKLLAVNIVGAIAGVNTQDLQAGKLRADDWQRADDAAVQLMDYPVYVVDTPNLSPSDILQVALRYKHKAQEAGAELGGLVVDYLQLLKPPKGSNAEERTSEISRQLVGVQRTLDVPLIAISQLSRDNEKNADKRPELHHLRHSGALEQDARMVMFLYREGYYKRQKGEWTQEDWQPEPVEVLVPKNNGGRVGAETLAFTAAYTRFTNYDRRR